MTFEYLAELQLNDGSLHQVDLEEHGWAEPERLSLTRVFTLVPKDPNSRWPFVRIHIPEGAKPIFKSRMNNVFIGAQAMGTPLMRAYAVGWFKDGDSHWTWVFPNGAIETETDSPQFNDLIVEAINKAAQNAQTDPSGGNNPITADSNGSERPEPSTDS